MKVLVTGAGGQLGLDLLDAFPGDDVVGLDHGRLDVSDRHAVQAAVTAHRPDVVVHAAAWTDVDGCEAAPGRAYTVNAHSAAHVATACRDVRARMVLLSTDYVFGVPDGRRDPSTPYAEDDPTGPLNVYGRSKEAGERFVRAILEEHHIVRTSWLSGARGRNFVRTMLEVGRRGGPVRVVDDQVGSPTSTRDLAASIQELCRSSASGTWHRTNSGSCSWYELARTVFDLVGLAVEVERCRTEELVARAPRPAFSVLSNDRAERYGFREMRPWTTAVGDLLEEIRSADAGPRLRV